MFLFLLDTNWLFFLIFFIKQSSFGQWKLDFFLIQWGFFIISFTDFFFQIPSLYCMLCLNRFIRSVAIAILSVNFDKCIQNILKTNVGDKAETLRTCL